MLKKACSSKPAILSDALEMIDDFGVIIG